jgi:hypothetical protein
VKVGWLVGGCNGKGGKENESGWLGRSTPQTTKRNVRLLMAGDVDTYIPDVAAHKQTVHTGYCYCAQSSPSGSACDVGSCPKQNLVVLLELGCGWW